MSAAILLTRLFGKIFVREKVEVILVAVYRQFSSNLSTILSSGNPPQL